MPVSLKTISVALGATGIVGGASVVTLWQAGYLNAKTDEASDTPLATISEDESQRSQESQSQIAPIIKQGNCKVIAPLEEGVFKVLGISQDEYTTVYCQKTNVEASKIKLKDNWTGLFPAELLVGYGDYLEENFIFNLETDTQEAEEHLDEKYQTTFTGNKFLHAIVTAAWGDDKKIISGKEFTIFKISEDSSDDYGNIYISFQKGDEE